MVHSRVTKQVNFKTKQRSFFKTFVFKLLSPPKELLLTSKEVKIKVFLVKRKSRYITELSGSGGGVFEKTAE